MNSGRQSEPEIVRRIQAALEAGSAALAELPAGPGPVRYKSARDPVTEADRMLDGVLRKHLLQPGETWISEESGGDTQPPRQGRVWIVDPLDGTREYVAGVPEWCLSVALTENGRGIAAGICNPNTKEMLLGATDAGVTYNGRPVSTTRREALAGALVLASRSEFSRGEWERFRNADATWTLLPKHGWDVAAGILLVEAAGGFVCAPDGAPLNLDPPGKLLPGLVAGASGLRREVLELLTANRS
jgi:myo-inositol-1(or 4)-monophosphatase